MSEVYILDLRIYAPLYERAMAEIAPRLAQLAVHAAPETRS